MKSHHRRQRSAGVTLVEVVVAVAIIGTLVAMSLGAQSRLVHQWKEADMRTQGAAIADEMLTDWWQSTGKVPQNAGGPVRTRAGWTWRTTPLVNDALAHEQLRIVRLSVYPPADSAVGPGAMSEVDVVVKIEPEPIKKP